MGATNERKNRTLKLAMILLSLVFLISAALLLLEVWEVRQGRFPEADLMEDTLTRDGVEYELKDNVETFLLLGLDKFDNSSSADSYNNDKQADFLMMFVFDNDVKRCSAIQINRDTMVNVSILGVAGEKVDSAEKQIALAHTYGNGRDVSCRNTADSVSELLLGVKVNHYVSLEMDAVAKLNDLVGGVEVTVLDDLTSVDETLVKGETLTLNGELALSYVRSRYGLEDSTNAARMKRQEQYVTALAEKFRKCVETDEEFVVTSSLEIADYMVSDRSVTQLQEIAEKFSEYEFGGVSTFKGKTKQGKEFIEFYPYRDSIEKVVIDLFYKPKD